RRVRWARAAGRRQSFRRRRLRVPMVEGEPALKIAVQRRRDAQLITALPIQRLQDCCGEELRATSRAAAHSGLGLDQEMDSLVAIVQGLALACVPHTDKSFRRQRCKKIRAFSQFRWAVRSETFRIAAISANENPQKNFRSTISASNGSVWAN